MTLSTYPINFLTKSSGGLEPSGNSYESNLPGQTIPIYQNMDALTISRCAIPLFVNKVAS